MKKSPFIYRLLCLAVMRFGPSLFEDWAFFARIIFQLVFIGLFYAILSIGSGRPYMKTIPGRIEIVGVLLTVIGITGIIALTVLNGSEFIGLLGVFPGIFYLAGIPVSVIGIAYGLLVSAKQEPIQPPQTTTGSSAPDRV